MKPLLFIVAILLSVSVFCQTEPQKYDTVTPTAISQKYVGNGYYLYTYTLPNPEVTTTYTVTVSDIRGNSKIVDTVQLSPGDKKRTFSKRVRVLY